MAVIRSSMSDRLVRDAVVLDLGDLRRQGDEIVAQARAKGEQIVREAQAERARLIAHASEEGRAKGHAEGLEKGLAEGREKGRRESLEAGKPTIEALVKAWSGALAEFERVRDELQQRGRRGVVELAVAIGEKVVRRAIEHDPGGVEEQIAGAIGMVLKSSKLVIRVHPEDLEVGEVCVPVLMARLGASTAVELAADPSLSRGSCVVRTDRGEIDATIETQVARIAEALLPEGRSAGGAPRRAGAEERTETGEGGAAS
jgi:flagellar assembly protein FliH